MKKALVFLTLSAALTLSACSDTSKVAVSNSPSPSPAATAPASTPQAATPTATATPKPASTVPAPSSSAVEAEITYDFEGSTVKKRASLYKSKQGFEMYLLPDFEVTGDPKKDVIRLKAKEEISMTIERLPEGTDQQPVADQAQKDLKAKYKDVRMDDSLRNNKFFQNSIIWNGADTASSTSIFFFYVNNHPFKATIYSNKPLETALLELQAMVQTVKVPEK